MAFTHVLSLSWQRSGDTLTKNISVVSDSEVNCDPVIALGGAAHEVDLEIKVANLKGLYLLSDQDCVLKTNSSSAPDNTISLKANQPLVWWSDAGYFTCPLTVDVTKIYGVNNAAADANVKLRVVLDSTP